MEYVAPSEAGATACHAKQCDSQRPYEIQPSIAGLDHVLAKVPKPYEKAQPPLFVPLCIAHWRRDGQIHKPRSPLRQRTVVELDPGCGAFSAQLVHLSHKSVVPGSKVSQVQRNLGSILRQREINGGRTAPFSRKNCRKNPVFQRPELKKSFFCCLFHKLKVLSAVQFF